MSTFVSFDTIFPNSAPTATARKAPAGPPDTSIPNPSIVAPIIPVTTLVNSTSGGALRLHATATPMAAPMYCWAIPPTSTKNDDTIFSPNRFAVCSPMVLNMTPISSDANSPSAMADSASCRYRFTDISISFRLKKLSFSCTLPFVSISTFSCNDFLSRKASRHLTGRRLSQTIHKLTV